MQVPSILPAAPPSCRPAPRAAITYPPLAVDKAPLKRGERVSIFWTDMNEWFTGTFSTSRVEAADGGGQQRACCIVYDATGPWAACNKAQLTYWHCLDDEQWQHAE